MSLTKSGSDVFLSTILKDPYAALNMYKKGILPGIIERPKVVKLSILDISRPIRPYFKSICRFDNVYVTLLRL